MGVACVVIGAGVVAAGVPPAGRRQVGCLGGTRVDVLFFRSTRRTGDAAEQNGELVVKAVGAAS